MSGRGLPNTVVTFACALCQGGRWPGCLLKRLPRGRHVLNIILAKQPDSDVYKHIWKHFP
eukprot:447175-Pyramimonas_sp.AAC.1